MGCGIHNCKGHLPASLHLGDAELSLSALDDMRSDPAWGRVLAAMPQSSWCGSKHNLERLWRAFEAITKPNKKIFTANVSAKLYTCLFKQVLNFQLVQPKLVAHG